MDPNAPVLSLNLHIAEREKNPNQTTKPKV